MGVASSVVHPYVATVFDVVESGSETFLIMELIEGRRLDHYLTETEPSIEPPPARRAAHQRSGSEASR